MEEPGAPFSPAPPDVFPRELQRVLRYRRVGPLPPALHPVGEKRLTCIH